VFGVGGLHLAILAVQRRVEVLGHVHVLREPLHRLPEVDLLLFERGVVLPQLVWPRYNAFRIALSCFCALS